MSEERALYDAGEQPVQPSVFHVEKSGHNLTEGGFPFCVVTETGDMRGIFCTEAEAGIFADGMNKQPATPDYQAELERLKNIISDQAELIRKYEIDNRQLEHIYREYKKMVEDQ